MADLAEIGLVREHVRSGARHIEGQRRIIQQLRSSGGDVVLAEQVLANFYDAQALHLGHLRRLLGR